ncbi:zinc ABC transporter substrate-binding protein [Paenirhodobacter sp.]|uniref:zinc ABC transporter substrate-binding protein n=1 Tax=Paenirhodobacter sp. TaxID=1965326 RepID=UPI003B4221F0
MSCLVLALAAMPALARAEVPKVVTDIPPVQSLVAQVMGDLGAPALLLTPGTNAHSYQMKPSQARALQDADLLIWIGPEMTPWLNRAAAASGAKNSLPLLHTKGTQLRDYAPEADHDHDHDHEEDGHHHEGTDPHAWLDPDNARTWLSTIAQHLAALDPEHAETYAANAEAARTRIAALDGALKDELAPVARRPFVVFHAAYGYFAAHYGLDVAGALSLGDAAEPGAAHLAELRAGLAHDAVACAFPEANHDPRPLDRLAEGTGVRIGGALDPEGSKLDAGPDLYDRILRSLSETIRDCLTQE